MPTTLGSYGALLAVLNQEATIHGYHLPIRSYGIPEHSAMRLDVAATEIGVMRPIERDLRFRGGMVLSGREHLDRRIQRLQHSMCGHERLALGLPPSVVQEGVARIRVCWGECSVWTAATIFGGSRFCAYTD